jgi:predicted tellurium resistance membrane protein TerC
MDQLIALAMDPAAWAALVTLVVMEVVLGIDNLVFVAILSNKLPEQHRAKARRIGISLALLMRLGLLATLSFIIGLVQPVFTAFGHAFSWRDLILIAGGLFLVWKATREIHHTVDPNPMEAGPGVERVATSFGSAIVQIILLDLVFSIDSILTAVGMTDHLPIMILAVLIAVGAMLLAANPLADFINKNPTVVMLALGFLLMIGMVLIAEGFGAHVPKGYIYAAMAFAGGVEALNMLARSRQLKARAASSGPMDDPEPDE